MTDSEDRTSGGRRKRWDLDRPALEALLAALDPDRGCAGERYEELRRRLRDLFSWERCEAPDELADEALNRLARKVMEGAAIPHLDRYAFGIARLLVLEDVRARRGRDAALRQFEMPAPDANVENTLGALEGCLAALPRENRLLIERYYSQDREKLAREFGISVNALRNRALRIREELFRCVSRKRDDS